MRNFNRSKKGLIIGAAVGVIIVLWFVIAPSRGPLLPGYNTSNVIFFIFSMCLPVIISGAISGTIIENFFIKKYILATKILANYKIGSMTGCIIGSLIFFPIGAFLGLIVGGQFGGGLGSVIGEKFGASKITISAGIAVGMTLVAIVVTLIGAAFGVLGGLLLNSVIRKMLRMRQENGKGNRLI